MRSCSRFGRRCSRTSSRAIRTSTTRRLDDGCSDAYLSDASRQREAAAQKNLTRYRKRAFKQAASARWLFIAGLVAVGFVLEPHANHALQRKLRVTLLPLGNLRLPIAGCGAAAAVDPPIPAEKWCAAFIRAGGARAKPAHAMETASEAVAACAPLLAPWLDEQESDVLHHGRDLEGEHV